MRQSIKPRSLNSAIIITTRTFPCACLRGVIHRSPARGDSALWGARSWTTAWGRHRRGRHGLEGRARPSALPPEWESSDSTDGAEPAIAVNRRSIHYHPRGPLDICDITPGVFLSQRLGVSPTHRAFRAFSAESKPHSFPFHPTSREMGTGRGGGNVSRDRNHREIGPRQ